MDAKDAQSNANERAPDERENQYLVVFPYLDRKYGQTLCWCGRVTAATRKLALDLAMRFLEDPPLVAWTLLGYAVVEGGPGFFEEYVKESWIDVGEVEVLEVRDPAFLKTLDEVPWREATPRKQRPGKKRASVPRRRKKPLTTTNPRATTTAQ